MDVMQVILPMCSDRVGSVVVIFDVFQSSVSDVTFPISVMAFHMDKLVIFKNTKFEKCAICVPSLISTTANSQTINSINNKLLPRSNGNISLFSFFLSPSSSLFLRLCLHHPSEPETGMFQKWTLMILC